MNLEEKVEQLQFPFMRNLNLQLYVREQRDYLKIRYDLYRVQPDRMADISFRDFVEYAILGGVAESFQNERHRKYFSEDHLIQDYR